MIDIRSILIVDILYIYTEKRDLMANLISLPILCHTVKQKNLKTDLETKLNEIDDAIKIFSRPKVYIKIA